MTEALALLEFEKLMEWFLPALALLTLGLSVLALIACNNAVKSLTNAQLQIWQKVKYASEAFKFPDVADYRPGGSKQTVAAPSYEVRTVNSNAPAERIERAIGALEAWRAATGEREKTRTFEAELRNLQDKIRRERRQSEVADLTSDASEQMAKALKVLLSATDRDKDPDRKNDTLQQVLLQLKESADCRFIDPNEGDPYDQSIHYPVEEPRSNGQQRKHTIASIIARGLVLSDGTVASKAEVAVYT